MGFADASVCPSCRGSIQQATTCPHCGLVLTTHEVQQAWQALVVADQWIERARLLQASGTTTPTTTTATVPQHPPTASSLPPRKRSVSAGSVLLGLGATAIVVAGIIFVSVSWGSLGVVGRALVLLLVTMLFGTAGWFVTRRGLRASAEALWSVFLALLTLDWFAAREQGLAGLDTWPFGASAATWAVMVIGTALVVVPWGRRHLDQKELMAPSIAAGAAAWFAAGSLAAELSDATDGSEFWPAVLATAVVGAATLVLQRVPIRVGGWIGVAGVAFFGLFAILFAVDEAIDHPSWGELAGEAHGLPLLVVVAMALGCGLVLARTRVVASVVVVAGIATLLVLPVEDAWPERGGLVLVAVLVAAGAWVAASVGGWFRGGRLTIALGVVGLALAASPWAARLLATIAEGAGAARTNSFRTVLRPDDAPEVGPWWVALVVAAGIAAALIGARRWPEATGVREHLVPTAWCVGVLGLWASLATFDLSAVAVGGDLVAGGALLTVIASQRHAAWQWVGPVVVAAAPIATISSWPASVVVWPVAGTVLAMIAVRTRETWLRIGAAFLATGWGLGAAAPALELLDGDDRWTALALVAAGLVGLAVSVLAVRAAAPRLAVQVASGVLGATGIILGSSTSTTGFASFTWTVAGAGVVLLSLVPPRNPWFRWTGAGLLGVGYVLRLVASDVEVVEAYTLPFAVLLLAAGLWAMRKDAELGTVRALLAGVVLALLPSLPQALDEPTGLRALLLGVGAVIALGIGTWRRWQVPFVAGALVLAILVVVNVAPVARELPLVVLLSLLGVVSLGAGFTWDDRVRDGRAAIRYVGSMR